MKILIDQSSKIEYTHQNSVVPFSNHHHRSILLKSKDKQELEAVFRKALKPKQFICQVFSALICILIEKEVSHLQQIIIDTEYVGQENLIKNYIIQMLRKKGLFFDKKLISFNQVGKKAVCHQIAIDTYNHKLKPDQVVPISEVLKYIL
ncbi:hypothetical protein KBC75_02885 [Candidatus Shapirobacteria bacterium]|nr:hypothetical protein [Candidatus Shapirobacteria bacterium]